MVRNGFWVVCLWGNIYCNRSKMTLIHLIFSVSCICAFKIHLTSDQYRCFRMKKQWINKYSHTKRKPCNLSIFMMKCKRAIRLSHNRLVLSTVVYRLRHIDFMHFHVAVEVVIKCMTRCGFYQTLVRSLCVFFVRWFFGAAQMKSFTSITIENVNHMVWQ